MSSVPLKLKDSADFQEFTSIEENYLAYQVGKELVYGDSSTPGSLALDSGGDKTNIGQFSDFSFDSAVGTGGSPGAIFSGTTITTQLYQNDGTVVPSDSDDRLPILQRDSDGQRVIREMRDSDMNVLLDRLNSRIHTSEYIGSYRLGTVPPDSSDWTETLSDVTTDTRTNGSTIQHNIYQKTNQTPPTAIRPFSIKRSGGKTGSYQGLQLMTDRQIQKSIGVRAKNRIASNLANSGVGSYRVQTSAQGTPTNLGYSGTWSARGVATDTRANLVDTNYTRTRQSTYSRLRSSAFSDNYIGNYTGAFTRDSSVSYTRDSTATFSKTRVSNYSLGFVGNFIGNYTTTRASTFTRNRASTLAYTTDSSRSFTGNYSRLLSFIGNFTGNFVGNYARTSTVTETDPVSALPSQGSAGNDSIWNYKTESETAIARAQIYGGMGGPSFSNLQIWVDGSQVVSGGGPGDPESLSFSTSGSGTFYSTSGQEFSFSSGDTFKLTSINSATGPSYTYYRVKLAGTQTNNYIGNYTRSSTSANTVDSTRVSTYARTRSSSYTGNFTRATSYLGNYTGEFVGNFTRDRQTVSDDSFTRDFTGNYSVGYARNFSRNFTRTRQSNYLGEYAQNFAGNFLGNYSGSNAAGVPYGANLGNALSGSNTLPQTSNSLFELTSESHSSQRYGWGGNISAAGREALMIPALGLTDRATIYNNDGSTTSKNRSGGWLWPYTRLRNSTRHETLFSYVAERESGGGAFSQITLTFNNNQANDSTYRVYYRADNADHSSGNYYYSISGASSGNTTVNPGLFGNASATLSFVPGKGNAVTFTNQVRRDGASSISMAFIIILTGNTAGTIDGNYTRTSTRTSTGNFQGTYSRNFGGNYAGEFSRNYTRSFTRARTSTYLGGTEFSREFLGNFIANYTGNYTRSFEGNYSQDFAGDYVGNYSRDFIGNYTRGFLGNYTGLQIGSGSTNVETYTLYVRTA